jgi:hypothetical protein
MVRRSEWSLSETPVGTAWGLRKTIPSRSKPMMRKLTEGKVHLWGTSSLKGMLGLDYIQNRRRESWGMVRKKEKEEMGA